MDKRDELDDLVVQQYAGFWRRTGAQLLDAVWQLPLIALFGWGIYGADYFTDASVGDTSFDTLWSYAISALAIVGFWWWRGASPGKWLMHVRIVDAITMARPGLGRLVLRYLAYWISFVPLMLGFLWIAFDGRKQGWHDKIARTVVIRDDDF